jgi:hypothetical protein
MIQHLVPRLGVGALALGLALPIGTVLCVHNGGHASLEAAALGGCTDTHDSSDHDTSSHRPTDDRERPGSCSDTLVDTAELKTAPATDTGAIGVAVCAAAGVPFLPPSLFDPKGLVYRNLAETTRWVNAFESSLRTTVVLC